jgi:hypothetical protein
MLADAVISIRSSISQRIWIQEIFFFHENPFQSLREKFLGGRSRFSQNQQFWTNHSETKKRHVSTIDYSAL